MDQPPSVTTVSRTADNRITQESSLTWSIAMGYRDDIQPLVGGI